MEGERIKDLNNLLKPVFGENVEIVDKTIANLTLPGENYLSDMFKLQVTTRNRDTNSTNTENFVAKCCIVDVDENMPKEAASHVFKPEIAFYKEIIPTMQKFLKEHGLKEVEIFAKLIASRYNLDGKEQPDENAVLILENLQAAGYSNEDRHKGFGLDGAKLVLADLAVFHAVPLAIKLKDPDLFQNVFVDNCSGPPKFADKPKDKGPGGPPSIPRSTLKEILKADSFCRKHVNRFDGLIDAQEENFKNGNLFIKPDANKSVFSGFVHKDMWLNNTMQMKNEEGKLIKNKFVDFQMYGIQDITTDLFFFLLTSVDIVTLEEHFDYLLMIYHEHFIKSLESFKCDVAPFKYINFIDSLKKSAIEEFFHILVMNIIVIYAKKGEKTKMETIKNMTVDTVHPIAKKKFVFLFKMCIQKEWI
ncbi:uncharacterized protein [Diabrotica undecimpunctata]|uniref:uncharacterized protein n=1 Tax=Diabrotica undecimpunctata TaxID=50387 RepID=UPI003B641C96